MILIKNKDEIKIMKKSGKINYLTHKVLEDNIKVGITTNELNDIAHDFIIKNNASPSFLNYDGFPKSICISINEEVVHGIPSDRKLKEGDIVSIDIGVNYKGYHSDSAKTHVVGKTTEENELLVKNTKESLYKGLRVIKEGVNLSLIGKEIDQYAKDNNLSVIRELVGHGVGKNLHEEPDIPNYYEPSDVILKEGMTLAIEPMLNLGERHIYIEDDDWTIKTEDDLPSAHFEHTILVTKDGYEILTGE